MAFKFAFSTLLRHRHNLEEAARKEFLEAQARVDQCLKDLDQLYEDQDQARLEIEKISRQGGHNSPRLQALDEFIAGTEIKIQRQRAKARELIQVAEDKRDILIEAAKEHKILLKVKDRRYAEFKRAERKREEKVMQDLVTMRFKRSQR